MTRVCVEWSRPETARLIGRCREALEASDETAKAAQSVSWPYERWWNAPTLASKLLHGTTLERFEADNDARFIAANDPSTRLALNRALAAVLDGIAATLSQDYQSRARDVEHALASLTAIAAALGVES